MIQTVQGAYNFAISGGIAGTTFETGIIIPQKASFRSLEFCTITSLVSGGAPVIDIGLRPIGNATPDNTTAFAAGVALAGFTAGNPILNVSCLWFSFDYAFKVILTITGAAPADNLTAGKVIINATFTDLTF